MTAPPTQSPWFAKRHIPEGLTRPIGWGVLLLLVFRCAWIFAAPLRSPDLPLRMAQDDFYYYLKPAQNLAWHHQSVYFDHVLTNGYHPLYFALLAGMSLFVHTLPGVFRFLWVLDVVSATAIFLLGRRFFGYLRSPLLANAFGVLLTLVSLPLICDQMEVTLALPMGLAFLVAMAVPAEKLTTTRLFVGGLLGALTVLARLDAGLLVLLYVVGALCTNEYRRRMNLRRVAAFGLGCLPLPLLYLWSNHYFFHTLLPISGMAKELRHGHKPSILLPASINGSTECLANLVLIAAVIAWGLRRYLLPREKVAIFATLALPVSFYGVEMFLSDWPIWNWYFYVLRFSVVGALVLVGVLATRSVVPGRYRWLKTLAESWAFAAGLCFASVAALFLVSYKVDHWMVEIQHAALKLDQFAQTHPGTYAMGDRAGMFGATTSNPLLQTEGLVMDKAYLQHIRQQENLRHVLAEYGVNYYVAFVFKSNESMQFSHGCFHAMEPSIAGPSALRMRADFCEPPVYQFPGIDGEYVIFPIRPEQAGHASGAGPAL